MELTIIGVLGLGVFGQTVAKQLSKYNKDVIAIDTDKNKVDSIADTVTTAIVGDFTDFDLLEEVGIANCDAVVIGTGTKLESAVLAVMHCKRLGVQNIIAKAHSNVFEQALYELGATSVISPERESGKRLASQLLKKHIDEVFALDSNTSIVEFHAPEKWIGHSILSLDLRKRYDINIIGIRTAKGGKIQPALNIDAPIEKGMVFVAIADSDTFESYDYLNRLK